MQTSRPFSIGCTTPSTKKKQGLCGRCSYLIRYKTNQALTSVEDEINWYSTIIETFLDWIYTSINQEKAPSLWAVLVSYQVSYNYLEGIVRMGVLVGEKM